MSFKQLLYNQGGQGHSEEYKTLNTGKQQASSYIIGVFLDAIASLG